jgi:hypothetical protein
MSEQTGTRTSQAETTCDVCRKPTTEPTSIVIRSWGGSEQRYLVCEADAEIVRNIIYQKKWYVNEPWGEPSG